MDVDDDARAGSVPEPTPAPIRVAEHELAASQPAKCSEDDPPGDVTGHLHGRIVPRPGTNGGFAKNGTRFRASRTA